MGDVDDDILKAQQERLGFKANFGARSVSYDEDIYGGTKVSTSEYNTELADEGDDAPAPSKSSGSRYSTDSREVIRKALSSYTAPKHLLESRPKADAHEDVDPMKEFKRKTVAEREDEYRARWRKRKLSPPRVMSFGKDAPATEGARSYREIMMEQQLEKEKKEILRKIQKKQEEEEENRKRELKDRNHGTLWDVREEGTERKDSNRTASGNWVMNVMKNDQAVGDPIVLNSNETFTIGRDRASNLPIDHPSCSKQHATITFKTQGTATVPQITDLGSTNGTKINDTLIGAHKAFPINAGDMLKFGGSTREYTFLQQ